MGELGEQRRLRILIADDEVIVREAIEAILNLEDDMEIVGMASNGLEAVELTERLAPDIILLDLSMPHLDGFEVIKVIREAELHSSVIVLDVRPDSARAQRIRESGALTFIDKSVPSEDLIKIIRSANVKRMRV